MVHPFSASVVDNRALVDCYKQRACPTTDDAHDQSPNATCAISQTCTVAFDAPISAAQSNATAQSIATAVASLSWFGFSKFYEHNAVFYSSNARAVSCGFAKCLFNDATAESNRRQFVDAR